MFQISHPWHSEGRESCKEGTQVRPLGNGNCKNNSSDCNQLTVSLQPSLESLGQPARQSSSQEEGADRGSHGGEIQHSKLGMGMETCPALPPWSSISTCLSVAHFPRSTAHQREHKSVYVRLMDLPPPTFFYFRSKTGVHHPSQDKKASISCRLHLAHGCNWKVTTSLSSAEQHWVIQSKSPVWNPHTNLTRYSQNLHFTKFDFIALWQGPETAICTLHPPTSTIYIIL